MSNYSKFSNADVANEASDFILSTLENRRDQIATRSTICLAAASGLMVLVVQFIFDLCGLADYTRYSLVILLLLSSVIICAVAIMTSLDLIKKISRKKHMGKGQKHTDDNLYYFGWIEQKNEDELYTVLERLTFSRYMKYNVRQAISLSKNLDYRYRQLDRTYKLLGVGLLGYILALIVFVIIKYNFIEILCNIFWISK